MDMKFLEEMLAHLLSTYKEIIIKHAKAIAIDLAQELSAIIEEFADRWRDDVGPEVMEPGAPLN